MLILKGKFLMSKRWAVRCAVVCSLLASAGPLTVAEAQAAGPAPAERASAVQPARAPDSVAAEFYGWYLEMLFADQDPLSDRHERFTRYVARELTRQLILRMQRPPLPELDYFLQARDYHPAWQQHMRTSVLRRTRDGAEVLLTLGGGEGPARVLVLTMVVENGAWKIRRVAPAGHSASESSAEQPVI
jgi:hypothetical protein